MLFNRIRPNSHFVISLLHCLYPHINPCWHGPPLVINKINWEDKGINIDGEHLSHLIFADDIVLVAKSPEEPESMLTDIHLASKPVGLSMNLSKTKVMLNESATTSTVAVDGNTIEKVDRYGYLGKTVTQAGDLLPEMRSRGALHWDGQHSHGTTVSRTAQNGTHHAWHHPT